MVRFARNRDTASLYRANLPKHAVILAMGIFAYTHVMPWSEIVPLLLTSILAATPVALPATFTLAAAIGARALAKLGVLPTRLTAVNEAASIDVLCSDKTETLTRNELTVTSVRPMPGFDKARVLGLAALTAPLPAATSIADELEKQGFRVLAVAEGPPSSVQIIGLIALSDPPRTDSMGLISELQTLGVSTVMVTGDAPVTAAIVAKAVGLNGSVCPLGKLPDDIKPYHFAVFAGVLPEGKYDLVKAVQKSGHTVGMCGDGANDAPALR